MWLREQFTVTHFLKSTFTSNNKSSCSRERSTLMAIWVIFSSNFSTGVSDERLFPKVIGKPYKSSCTVERPNRLFCKNIFISLSKMLRFFFLIQSIIKSVFHTNLDNSNSYRLHRGWYIFHMYLHITSIIQIARRQRYERFFICIMYIVTYFSWIFYTYFSWNFADLICSNGARQSYFYRSGALYVINRSIFLTNPPNGGFVIKKQCSSGVPQ